MWISFITTTFCYDVVCADNCNNLNWECCLFQLDHGETHDRHMEEKSLFGNSEITIILVPENAINDNFSSGDSGVFPVPGFLRLCIILYIAIWIIVTLISL